MRLYIAEVLARKFFRKKRVDIDPMFRMEDIGILRVFDSFPGDMLLEFSGEEVAHMASIFQIVEKMKQDRLAIKDIKLVESVGVPVQGRFRFWEENQFELFAA